MAITERYVTATGTDTYANSTNSDTPMSLATAWANATAGDRIWIKKGTYSQGATTYSRTGTAASPIVFVGYDTTITSGVSDLASAGYNANGTLVTTGTGKEFPIISQTTGTRFNGGSSTYTIFRNLSFVGAGSGLSSLVLLGANVLMSRCTVSNPLAGAGAAVVGGGRIILHDCDIAATGNNSGVIAASLSASDVIIGCRITQSVGVGITVTGSNCLIIGNTFFAAVTNVAIDITNATASSYTNVIGNTIQGKATAIRLAATAYTNPALFANNHLTDNSTAAISSGTQIPAVFLNNRFRDNAADVNGMVDWKAGGSVGEITTDTGTATSDYTDTTNNLYKLIGTAPAIGKGCPNGVDIGALQRNASVIVIED